MIEKSRVGLGPCGVRTWKFWQAYNGAYFETLIQERSPSSSDEESDGEEEEADDEHVPLV